MKKIVTALLAIILICTLCVGAFAEEFSIRNGIHFGMTVDEVKEAEKAGGNEDKLVIGNSGKEVFYDSKGNKSIKYWKMSLAGIEDSSIEYNFDGEKDSLYEIIYSFEGSKDPYNITSKHVIENIESLYASLSLKYGDAYFYPGCEEHGGFFTKQLLMEADLINDGVFQLLGFYEWLVECDGGYVIIDLYGKKYHLNDDSYYNLVYDYVEEDYIAGILQERADRQEQINSDL